MGVHYYAVFDPLRQIQRSDEMNGEFLRAWDFSFGRYVELSPPFWLETVGLGLKVWEGEFESVQGTWLRWYDRNQQLIPTGAEAAEIAQQEAELERQKAELKQQKATRLAERLREMGIDPDQI